MRLVFWKGGSGARRIYVKDHGLPAIVFIDRDGIRIDRASPKIDWKALEALLEFTKAAIRYCGGVETMLNTYESGAHQRGKLIDREWRFAVAFRVLEMVFARLWLHVKGLLR